MYLYLLLKDGDFPLPRYCSFWGSSGFWCDMSSGPCLKRQWNLLHLHVGLKPSLKLVEEMGTLPKTNMDTQNGGLEKVVSF